MGKTSRYRETALFEELCRSAIETDRLETMVDGKLQEIFGMAWLPDLGPGVRGDGYCSFDYHVSDRKVRLIEFPKGFRPTPAQLEAVWALGAERLDICCYTPDGRSDRWYFYRGGPVEGKQVEVSR